MSNAQTLCEAISRWLNGKGNRSLSMLSRLSKVHYSTVRRIVQGESTPLADTALKLAEVVMNKDELSTFAAVFAPKLANNRTDIAYKTDDVDLMEFVVDRRYIPILLLSSHSDGTNEDEVRNFFGQEMTYRFEELVNSGHLARYGSDNWRLEKDIGTINLETTREWLSVMASICPSANDEYNCSSLAHVGFETVNFQTALAIYHAGLDFVRKAVKLASDKNNRGDVLVIFGSLFNVLKGVEAFK